MKEEVARKILNQTKDNYSKIAVGWDRTRQYISPGSEDFLEYIKEGNKVLDVGCGNGRLVKLFDNVNIEYTGVDNNEELLKIAKSNFSSSEFLKGDILNLPFNDNSFDVIFCIAVFHHLPGRLLRKKALGEINRALKPGGFLILLNWHYSSPKMISRLFNLTLAKFFAKSELDFGDVYIGWGDTDIERYVHLFTKTGISKLLKFLNFKVLQNYISLPTKRGFKNIVTIAKKC